MHVVAQMTHTSTQPSNTKAAPFSKHETIKFDHSDDMHTPKTADVRQVKTSVDALCAQTHRAAMHFAELVHNLRGLSQQEITSISNKDCTAFVDGLAMCGSANCIAHLATLINHGAASESVFSALAFVHNPDKAVIDHVASFIARVPHQGLLGVTSLVQSYCLSHPHCGTEPGVKRIIDALLQKIPRGCTVGKHFAEVEKAVYVLKAIGNIGNEDISLTLLNDCVANEKNPLEVQLSAIDALRRKPCTDKRNKNIDHLFFDEEEDEEVRIAAFAQLMECADEAIVDKVIDHFHNETSNQVGSYVWSYLNAKRRSSKPGNEELQRILKKKHIPQRFDLDPRRFSRFYEVGYFDPENNYGGHMDSSVIFSPKGYIPRGVNFNFTIHLFGKSLNILELDARAEGLEQLDNELFGADGYISNPNGHVFHDKKFQSHNAKVNQLKVLFQKKGDFIEDQLSGSLSARMFGDDVKYFAFEKDHFFENAKEYFALDKTLPKLAKEMKFEKSRNLMLVDVRRLLPTVCGLPLQIALNAAVKSKVSYKAKLNLVDLLHQRPNADALLEAQPSASVFATLSVSLLAAEAKSGVRCESTLYSATSVSGEVSLKDGKKFLAKINLPDDDAKLVHYERKISRIDNNRITAIPTPQAPGSKHHYCTSSTTGKVTGLKMCAEWQNNYPSVLAEVSVEKVDPQLKSYELKIDHESSRGEDLRDMRRMCFVEMGRNLQDAHQKMLMSVDTPGSKVNRKMETSFDLSIPRKTLKMNVITPFKKIMVDGNLVEKRPRQEYDAKLKLNIDDRKHYDLDGSFKAGTHQGRTKYTLTAKTLAGSAETADLKTEIEYSGRKSPYASVDFHLDKVFEKPIVFKTLMNLAGPHYQSKLEYSGPKFNGKLDGDLHHTGGFSYKGSVKGDYQVGNEKKHLLNIGSEQTFKMKGKDHNLKNSISVESSSLGKYDYTVYSKREGNDMKNAIEVDYRGKKSTVNVDIKRNANDLYTAIATAKCDRLGVNHKANIAYQNKFPMQFQLKVDAETPTMKNIHAGVEYQMRSSPKWTFNGKARLAYPGKEFVATEHIDEQVAGKYKAVTMVQWDRNGKVDVNSEILFKPKEHEYSIDSVVNVAGMRGPIHLKKHVKYRQDHYNVHWQAKHGNVIVYEIIGSTNGKFGAPQKIDLDVKSQKFDPKFHYHLAGNVQPTADTMKLDAVIKKDNRQVAKGDILVPKNFKAPSQKYSGHFDWTYENVRLFDQFLNSYFGFSLRIQLKNIVF
ncbi:unnamed protein product [Anisakis simplex]|uniref:Apolipophorins (inferred by orthology to a D. melanogaster protein) n=1 Tax=Anisakis simplex TaxID=6269 RepID=A0A0M3IYH2_ANISI|nr:unnamed protein product [Anisakis simplex]